MIGRKPRPSLPPILKNLRLPMVAAPMFIVSQPKLVIAQCKAGIVGSFPALSAREEPGEPPLLEAWLKEITEELDRYNQENPDAPAAPFAVNLIVNDRNPLLDRDVEICMRWKVPIWITSLGARKEVNDAAHSCGAIVLHDVINDFFARKAVDRGADGLVAVAAGAGGHAGATSPLALIQEIREWFDGPLLLSGAIGTGRALLAAQVMGADMGYVGTAFIATEEAKAAEAYKQMIVDGSSGDIVYTSLFSGISANYLKPSIRRMGMDPDNLPERPADMPVTAGRGKPKAWSEIWGSGQGISPIDKIVPVAELVDRFEKEYRDALAEFSVADSAPP